MFIDRKSVNGKEKKRTKLHTAIFKSIAGRRNHLNSIEFSTTTQKKKCDINLSVKLQLNLT